MSQKITLRPAKASRGRIPQTPQSSCSVLVHLPCPMIEWALGSLYLTLIARSRMSRKPELDDGLELGSGRRTPAGSEPSATRALDHGTIPLRVCKWMAEYGLVVFSSVLFSGGMEMSGSQAKLVRQVHIQGTGPRCLFAGTVLLAYGVFSRFSWSV
ncbi:hypothetical protein BJY00DRAFT_25378 [Aspergillus carlsbadensis]|nr:hypothetical protein BJY00DRAFT_25378 [Aspergillus carlsbadensis]